MQTSAVSAAHVRRRVGIPFAPLRSCATVARLDAAVVALGSFVVAVVVPRTSVALYGRGVWERPLSGLGMGPTVLLLLAIGLAVVSAALAVRSIRMGFPVIERGNSSRAGRMSRRLLEAALFTIGLGVIQLALFAILGG